MADTVSNKVKVLIAADTFYPKVDGVLVFMTEFISRAKQNFDLHLLVPKFSNTEVNGVKTTLLDLSKYFQSFNYNSIKFSLRNLHRIRKAVKETDLVFIQEFAPVGILAQHYAKKYKKKVICYVHNTPWEFIEKYFSLPVWFGRLLKAFMIRLYQKSDLLLIPYPELKQQLLKKSIQTPTVVARLGVDIDRFKPSVDVEKSKEKIGLKGKKVITYVGRISNEKNIMTLVEAFMRLKEEAGEKDIVLLIVGDGNKVLVDKIQASKDVHVTGFVNDVEKYLQASDIFVMPSLTETTSLATLEAMSTALPVITTKVGYLQEYITKGHNGLFFPKNSSAHLAMKIERLLKDELLRKYLGKNARKTITYSFSWDRSINKIKRLLYQQHLNTAPPKLSE